MSFTEVISSIVGISSDSACVEVVSVLAFLVVLVCIVSCFFSAIFSFFK